jgi:hypothetical protein
MEQSACQEIKAKIEVFDSNHEGKNGSVKIDLNGQSSSLLIVSLVGPKKYLRKDILEQQITGLDKGRYTLVFGGRNEEDNFCQKHFEFIIK